MMEQYDSRFVDPDSFGGETACVFFPCDGSRCEETNRLLRALSDRNRKLACLYAVSETLHAHEPDSESFVHIARLVKKASVHPEITKVVIRLDGEAHLSDEIGVSTQCIRIELEASGRKRGALEVCHTGPGNGDHEDLSSQDRDLADAVARQLTDFLERRDAADRLIQASKLASIGELAAGVSHEICNPVNGIINCADLLLREMPERTEGRVYLELIRSEAERVARIARNVLRFSRHDLERHSRVSLRGLIDEVLGIIGKRIERAKIALQIDVPAGLAPLLCHKEEMLQVLMNLLLNSIHALDERYPAGDPGKRLHVSARQGVQNGRALVRLTVEDRGAGVAAPHLDRLFDPFFTTKARDKGTGLGLSISDGIVRAHGGAISVESVQGDFARFHVDLPLDHDWTLETPAGPETCWEL